MCLMINDYFDYLYDNDSFFSRRFPIYRSYIIHRSICTLRIKRLNVSLSLQEKLEKAAENHVHRDVCLALLAKINTLEELFLRVLGRPPDTRGQDQHFRGVIFTCTRTSA